MSKEKRKKTINNKIGEPTPRPSTGDMTKEKRKKTINNQIGEPTPRPSTDDNEGIEDLIDKPSPVPSQDAPSEQSRTSRTPNSHETTPEPIYDEPILSEIIVQSFEGDKVKGLYEGEGRAKFQGGHTYRGMFSQGQMHGRGVYKWADGTRYEGDFHRSQITGLGKYTWANGNSYDGNVVDGKRHGFGTFRTADEKLTYYGEWKDGKKHGVGRLDYSREGDSFFDGNWENGVKHGWGVRQFPSGNVYYGMWFNNVRHGEGTMEWRDRDQIYAGHWEHGAQHGLGQHIWLLRRVDRSQYPLRNLYDGELRQGLRHGRGVFYYANGAKYDGLWRDNMKHGHGKFIFKNGRVYEGMFHSDHIVEFPDFSMDGITSPDISQLRTKAPDNISIHSNESRNTMSPNFQLDIDTLLTTLPPDDREYEVRQLLFLITRHVTALRRIYTYYSNLCCEESPDNTFIMTKMQYWRFLKDIKIHHGKYTLTDFDRLIGVHYQSCVLELHNPYEKILQRQFLNYLVIIAHHLFKDEYKGVRTKVPLLEYCFKRLMLEQVMRFACLVKSPIYSDIKRANNTLVHMDRAFNIYVATSKVRKQSPREPVLKMRQFLFLLKDLDLINSDLSTAKVIEILGSNNPGVCPGEGCYNLELEMTFLEFFEALVGCAEVFVTEKVIHGPETPQPTVWVRDKTLESLQYGPENEGECEDGENGDENHEESIIEDVEAQLAEANNDELDRESLKSRRNDEEYDPQSPDALREALSEMTEKEKPRTDSKDHVDRTTTNVHSNSDSLKLVDEDRQKQMSNLNMTSQGSGQKPSQMRVSDARSLEAGGGQAEVVADKDGEASREEGKQDEELDSMEEATKNFNFWTHQIHIFFERIFFPPAEKYVQSMKLLDERGAVGAWNIAIESCPNKKKFIK